MFSGEYEGEEERGKGNGDERGVERWEGRKGKGGERGYEKLLNWTAGGGSGEEEGGKGKCDGEKAMR